MLRVEGRFLVTCLSLENLSMPLHFVWLRTLKLTRFKRLHICTRTNTHIHACLQNHDDELECLLCLAKLNSLCHCSWLE